jgi:hypothetical protein
MLEDEDVPELDRPLRWTVLRGKREALRAESLSEAREMLAGGARRSGRPQGGGEDRGERGRKRGGGRGGPRGESSERGGGRGGPRGESSERGGGRRKGQRHAHAEGEEGGGHRGRGGKPKKHGRGFKPKPPKGKRGRH